MHLFAILVWANVIALPFFIYLHPQSNAPRRPPVDTAYLHQIEGKYCQKIDIHS